MFYRENGQFKTSYRADQQIFPIVQDRWGLLVLLAIAVFVVPMLVDEYMFRAILIPFLILSLAALGVNVLVGYCGQISLGSGAFMAVGAYMAYNTYVRIEGVPLIVALLSGGFFATLVGMFFGIPSLRVKGLYLAVATLAAQIGPSCELAGLPTTMHRARCRYPTCPSWAGRLTHPSTNTCCAWPSWCCSP